MRVELWTHSGPQCHVNQISHFVPKMKIPTKSRNLQCFPDH